MAISLSSVRVELFSRCVDSLEGYTYLFFWMAIQSGGDDLRMKCFYVRLQVACVYFGLPITL